MFSHDRYLNFEIIFQQVAKLLKLNHFLKKALRPILKTITLFHPPLPSLLSKIIERIVDDQAEEFLNKNKLLYRFQSSFLEKLLYKHLSWTSHW